MNIEKVAPPSSLVIPIDNEKNRFDSFLKLIGNERIIFSGIFGSGKTYFLKKFFENHPKFIPIHIYPTNYSVSKNEDIFELIKYDILYEVLKANPELEKLDVSSLNALLLLDGTDQFEIFKSFLSTIPGIGKKVKEIIEPLEHLVKTVNKKIKEKKESIEVNDANKIKEFSDSITNKQGHAYENDFYTQLISKLIGTLKANERNVVLIVDDLDRIDPEHIFRIINIFAVHFDVKRDEDSENKFGLDKIVLSCDIVNIRNIFSSRYGANVVFNGYIDKFYSRDVFYFNNTSIVIGSIEKIIDSMDFFYKERDNLVPMTKYKLSLDYRLLKMIFFDLIVSNILNLRTLMKLNNLKFHFEVKRIVTDKKTVYNVHVPYVSVFELLAFMFGGFSNLIVTLGKSDFKAIENSRDYREFFSSLMVILEYKKHNFQGPREHTGYNYLGKSNREYTYSLEKDNFSEVIYATYRSETLSIIIDDFKDALLNAIATYSDTRDKIIPSNF